MSRILHKGRETASLWDRVEGKITGLVGIDRSGPRKAVGADISLVMAWFVPESFETAAHRDLWFQCTQLATPYYLYPGNIDQLIISG